MDHQLCHFTVLIHVQHSSEHSQGCLQLLLLLLLQKQKHLPELTADPACFRRHDISIYTEAIQKQLCAAHAL
jgi:hypothetical protein